MLAALPEEKYETRDIFIDRAGTWHLRGIPVEPFRAVSQIDVALNALHGGIGEDGTVQRVLEHAGVPYAGARPLSASLSLNKIRTHGRMRDAGVRMPHSTAFYPGNPMTTGEMAVATFSEFGPPYVVKPAQDGASRGVRMVHTIIELPDAIGDALDEFGPVLVQEFLRGAEVSVGIIENFRGQDLYTLPPAHVVLPLGKQFLEFEAHEQSLAQHVVPSNFSDDDKRALEDIARRAHRALGMDHFSRADIILVRGKPYLLEVNAIPGLYQGASFPHMLESVGSSVTEFLEHAIGLAMR